MLQRHQYVQELVAEAEEKIKEDKGDKEAKEKLVRSPFVGLQVPRGRPLRTTGACAVPVSSC